MHAYMHLAFKELAVAVVTTVNFAEATVVNNMIDVTISTFACRVLSFHNLISSGM